MSRTSNVTAAFIDLATFELLESSLYGGSDAITYFVREVQKCTWFSQIPVKLTSSSGTPNWGGQANFTVSRAADYLLGTWLRIELPSIELNATATTAYPGGVSWTPNLGHNVIEKVDVLFNDLEVQSITSFDLDWWAAFMYPAGKKDGYNQMIGNVSTLVSPSNTKDAYTINVPIPFFYTRDSGVALPTAALPYNDIKLKFKLRELKQVLVGWGPTSMSSTALSKSYIETNFGLSANSLEDSTCECWCNYAVVSNNERSKMGAGPRDIVIEQYQKHDVPASNHTAAKVEEKQFSFNHTVKLLVWAFKNFTNHDAHGYHSNYTVTDPDVNSGFVLNGADPLSHATLKYDNTERFTLFSDYFQLVQPFYHANQIPSGNVGASPVGINMYSYALNPMSSDPSGSTNYGKLTNVSLRTVTKNTAATLSTQNELLIRALNFNIVRISGGALGFPVL
tara:strand:- start:288 stop:1640 length:1353 start_codon:yes stop_codon:yes gene_type:complete